MRATAVAAVLALPLLLAPSGCGRTTSEPVSSAEAATLELFRLARLGDAERGAPDAPFDSGLTDDGRAALYDALDLLALDEQPEVVSVESLPEVGRTAVDLSAALAGGGAASYSVQLEQIAEETWIVRWFQGPGVEWPSSRKGRDSGLTSSPPPDGADG